MAANILAHCGWEAGAILDSALDAVAQRTSFQLASLWTANVGTYGGTIQPSRGIGGQHALGLYPAGFCGPNTCRAEAFIARATAANTKVWWGGWVYMGYPANWQNTEVDDQYLLLACTQTVGGAASKHLGIGLILTAGAIWGIQINVNAAAKTYTRTDIGGNFITQGVRAGDAITLSGFTNAGNNGAKVVDTVTATVITVTSGTGLVNETGDGNEALVGPVRFKFEAYRLTTTSVIDGAALVPGSAFSADFFADTWYWIQLEVDITTRVCKLYVWDGVSEVFGTSSPDTTGTDYPSYFVPRYQFGGGKGSDAGFTVIFDDWSSADTANSGQRPNQTYVEVGHQPAGDIVGESDFTGVGDGTNKYRNWDDENDDAPSPDDENVPTGVGDTQVSTIVNKKAAGSVEAVTLVFASNSGHKIRARTGGTYQEYPSPGQGYSGAKDWYGKPFNKTPDSPQATWSNALFDLLEAGVTAIDTEPVGEFYALAFGPSLERPDKTPAVPRSFVIPRHRQLNTLLRM